MDGTRVLSWLTFDDTPAVLLEGDQLATGLLGRVRDPVANWSPSRSTAGVSSKVDQERTRVPSIAGSAGGHPTAGQVDGGNVTRHGHQATSATAAPSTGPIGPEGDEDRPPDSVATIAPVSGSSAADPLAQAGQPSVPVLGGGQHGRANRLDKNGTGRAMAAELCGRRPPPSSCRSRPASSGRATPSQPWSAMSRHSPASKGQPEERWARSRLVVGAVVEEVFELRPGAPADPPTVRNPWAAWYRQAVCEAEPVDLAPRP